MLNQAINIKCSVLLESGDYRSDLVGETRTEYQLVRQTSDSHWANTHCLVTDIRTDWNRKPDSLSNNDSY